MGQDRGSRGAVAGVIGSLFGDFTDHLSAHIFIRVLQVDLFGDRNTVFSDKRCAELLIDHNVAAAGAERDCDRSCKNVHAAFDALTRIF